MKLYEIPHAMRQALDSLEVDEETGEILNPEQLHIVEASAADKIEAAALWIREQDAEAKAVAEEAERLHIRAKAMTKRCDRVKALMLDALYAFDGKVKTPRVTVSLRKSKAVVVDEGANLPEAYTTIKTTVSPNKTAIKDALSAGIEVPGCHIEERESVQIR